MNQAIQKRTEGTALALGTFRNALQVNQLMERAQSEAILVSPATSVGAMPEGVGIALTKVVADVTTLDAKGNLASNDTYDVGGKRGLSKTVLQKIAAALGVSWDPRFSGRLDDGRDPHYCHWRAVGSYRSFDGQIQTIQAEKEMDLRAGSPQVLALWERYKARKALCERKGWDPPNEPTAQVREMRLHILAHAESKAQLRAIRSLGIKTSYTVQELQKPFVCARVMWTGETDDPELRRIFAEKQADAFLGGTRALFGGGGEPHDHMPGRAGHARQLLSAPPVGSVPADVEDLGELGADAEAPAPAAQQQPAQPAQAAQPAQQPPQQQGAQQPPAQQQRKGAEPTLPAGDSKGLPLAQAQHKDLSYWSNRLERELAEGTSRAPKKDQDLLEAVQDELARRAEQTGGGENDGGDQGGLY